MKKEWTMISLASIAISVTIGLVSIAYGQTQQIMPSPCIVQRHVTLMVVDMTCDGMMTDVITITDNGYEIMAVSGNFMYLQKPAVK